MGLKDADTQSRLDPVETPMVLGLVIMVLGISLGNISVISVGSLVIVISAIFNLLFSRDEIGHNNTANSHVR